MMKCIMFFVFNLLLILTESTCVPKDDAPLFLTPYIENGELEEGRKLAEVPPFLGNVKSYSGMLTVDKNYNSNLFFWYFPAERRQEKVPLLLWINGYGTASTYGVFLQNGPYNYLTEQLKPRNESWHKYFNIIYIDSPVGVGYSFTNSIEGYSTDLDKVTANLQRALEQFLTLFPNLNGREFYLTGLSLGGKYLSALAHRIYKNDSFNLKGVFLGNPLLDIDIQMRFSSYLYELGFIERNQIPDLLNHEEEFRRLLLTNDYDSFNKYSDRFWLDSDSYLHNITGVDVFDYDVSIDTNYYMKFLDRKNVRKALHVGSLTYNDGVKAMSMFGQGIAFSVLGYLGEMLETMKIMFYSGQTDISCAYPMMVDALTAVKWSGQKSFNETSRTRLYDEDGNYVWGYMRSYDTLTEVMIRKAGHSAVSRQPGHVLWLLKKLTNYSRFT